MTARRKRLLDPEMGNFWTGGQSLPTELPKFLAVLLKKVHRQRRVRLAEIVLDLRIAQKKLVFSNCFVNWGGIWQGAYGAVRGLKAAI